MFVNLKREETQIYETHALALNKPFNLLYVFTLNKPFNIGSSAILSFLEGM